MGATGPTFSLRKIDQLFWRNLSFFSEIEVRQRLGGLNKALKVWVSDQTSHLVLRCGLHEGLLLRLNFGGSRPAK